MIALPLRSQPSAAYVADGSLLPQGAEPLLTTVLRAGDSLYLPRGYIHAAETNADRSIHLTVGVAVLTWYDVLHDILPLAGDEVEFRDAVPASVAEAVPHFLQAAAKWVELLAPQRVEELVRTRLARSIPAEPVPVLAQADAVHRLDAGTPVRARAGLAWSVSGDADRITLRLPDRDVTMPVAVEPVLRQVLSGPPAAAADLGGSSLTVDDVLVLLRRLLRERAVVARVDRSRGQ